MTMLRLRISSTGRRDGVPIASTLQRRPARLQSLEHLLVVAVAEFRPVSSRHRDDVGRSASRFCRPFDDVDDAVEQIRARAADARRCGRCAFCRASGARGVIDEQRRPFADRGERDFSLAVHAIDEALSGRRADGRMRIRGRLAVVDEHAIVQRIGRRPGLEHFARDVVFADDEVGRRQVGDGLAAAVERADVDVRSCRLSVARDA